jgi:broad specificity phosphatase PhoE
MLKSVQRSLSSKRNIDLVRKLDLLLIRHAESTNNTLHNSSSSIESVAAAGDWRKKRQADCELSLRGKEQTKYLNQYAQSGGWGQLLPSPPVYYSSPMKRCLETMNAITSSLLPSPQGGPSQPQQQQLITSAPQVNVIPNLYEFGGCYQIEDEQVITLPGMTKAQIESTYQNFHCGPGLSFFPSFPHLLTSPLSLSLSHSLCISPDLFLLSEMADGWYHHPHRETRNEFEERSLHLSNWIWSLLTSQPLLDSPSALPPVSTSTAVLVIHGYLLSALLNQILFKRPDSCVFIHSNTGITHLELMQFQSGDVACTVKFQNSLPHLTRGGIAGEVLRSGDDLVLDQWIKIFQ